MNTYQMKFKYLLLSLLFIPVTGIQAQSELSGYFMNNTGVDLYLNPAKTTDARLSWVLPSGYYGHGINGSSILKMFRKGGISSSRLTDDLKSQNSMLFGGQLSLFGFNYSQDNFSIQFGQNLKGYIQTDYNFALVDMILNGNAGYIGQNVNIGPYLDMLGYNEIYLGGSYTFGNLRLGAKIKKLNGIGNLYTPQNTFAIYTDDKIYELSFTNKYHIYTNAYSDSWDSAWQSLKFWGNNGWSFDFGIEANINDQFKVSATLLDMGSIRWKNNPSKIISEGNFEFTGINLDGLFTDTISVFDFDTIGNLFNFDVIKEAYRSPLPVQLYLGFQYFPTEQWEVNALYYDRFSAGRSHPAFMVMGKYKPSEYFHAGMSYTINRYSYFNVGLTAELHAKWFHAFIAMDNITDIFTPLSSDYFNIRMGTMVDLWE